MLVKVSNSSGNAQYLPCPGISNKGYIGYLSSEKNSRYCYEYGIGTDKNQNKAFEWYLKSAENGIAMAQYNLAICYEDGIGTNPEELVAAAHAGCFSMALSGQLGNAGLTADSINTTAAVTLEKTDAGFTVT